MAKASRLKAQDIEEIFRRFALANPEPKGELNSLNNFTLLVAVVLSAQATDEGVNRATKPLFALADTPERMVVLGEERRARWQAGLTLAIIAGSTSSGPRNSDQPR